MAAEATQKERFEQKAANHTFVILLCLLAAQREGGVAATVAGVQTMSVI